MSRPLFIVRWGLGLATVLTLGGSCGPGEGGRCFCQGECRGGLVCAADGAVLRKGQCVTDVSLDIDAGECVDQGNVPDDDAGSRPPPYFDLGSHAPGVSGDTSESGASTGASTDSSTGTGSGTGSGTATTAETETTTESGATTESGTTTEATDGTTGSGTAATETTTGT